MDNTTEVVNEVVEDVVEETASKASFGTFVTGGILLVGTVTVIYGAVKGTKWGIKKVKGMIDSKKKVTVVDENWNDGDYKEVVNPED